jgi:hypothetical protein
MAGKYMPLEKYLRELPANLSEVTLGFEQIEGILNNKLPASAYEDQRWWEHETEGNHINQRAWTTAGWEINSLDVKAQMVKFTRIRKLSS